MIKSIKKIFSLQELRNKIFFTIALLIICRIGAFISIPGINSEEVLWAFQKATGEGNNVFKLVDIFSGGAFSQMTVTALGVMPYISASIIMQLMMIIFPSLQREVREMPEIGRRKIAKFTRLFTILLAGFQSYAFAVYATNLNESHEGIIANELLSATIFGTPMLFYIITIATMTTGTLFLMWIGELISENGIGNGMSLIIALNILASFPASIKTIFRQFNLESQEAGEISLIKLIMLAAIFVGVIVATILIIKGQKKIPLQYARRVVGIREMQGSGAAYIPLKVNYAGVIPVIFASALLMFPSTIAQFLGDGAFAQWIVSNFSPNSFVYSIIYVSLIIFFTYFWTAMQFHPEQISSEMKRGGAFIPGIKHGKATQKYLDETMHRVTFIGAIFLALIAVFPIIFNKFLKIDPSLRSFLGGTSLLILVGVILDTAEKIDSQIISKKYCHIMSKSRRMKK